VYEDGAAVHYTAVTEGTPVFSSDDVEVGRVLQVLDNYREHIFDGLVIETRDGDVRFVDAPEVRRTAELAVTLTITAAEAEQLPPPEKGVREYGPNRGRLGRLMGRSWKRKR
jgi:hypothetical protein